MDKTIKTLLIIVLVLGVLLALRVTVFKDVKFGKTETEQIATEQEEQIANTNTTERTQSSNLQEKKRDIDLPITVVTIGICVILIIIFFVLPAIGLWKIFKNAGIPGFFAIIPFLNTVKLCSIVGLSGWWVLAEFIPFIGGVIAFILNMVICYRLAQIYNKSVGYALGLMFLPFIFYPLLGFKGEA